MLTVVTITPLHSCDGRTLDDLRPIDAEVDMFPTLHGSSLFKRGESQVYVVVITNSYI